MTIQIQKWKCTTRHDHVVVRVRPRQPLVRRMAVLEDDTKVTRDTVCPRAASETVATRPTRARASQLRAEHRAPRAELHSIQIFQREPVTFLVHERR